MQLHARAFSCMHACCCWGGSCRRAWVPLKVAGPVPPPRKMHTTLYVSAVQGWPPVCGPQHKTAQNITFSTPACTVLPSESTLPFESMRGGRLPLCTALHCTRQWHGAVTEEVLPCCAHILLRTHLAARARAVAVAVPCARLQTTSRLFVFGGERDAGVLDDMWTLKGLDGSEPYRQDSKQDSKQAARDYARAGCWSSRGATMLHVHARTHAYTCRGPARLAADAVGPCTVSSVPWWYRWPVRRAGTHAACRSVSSVCGQDRSHLIHPMPTPDLAPHRLLSCACAGGRRSGCGPRPQAASATPWHVSAPAPPPPSPAPVLRLLPAGPGTRVCACHGMYMCM